MARSPCSASARTCAWAAVRSPGPIGNTPAAVRIEVQSGITASGAPLAISILPSGPSASTEPSRRLKSKACRASKVQPRAAPAEPATSAASSAPRSPPSSAEMAPSRAARSSAVPAASRLLASVISAEVSVPVLSVHRIVMAPRSWIDARRFTITLRAAMRSAPRDSVTVVIIGSSSGVRPTASATENSSDSSTGRPNSDVRGQHHQDKRDGEPRDQQAERVQVALKGRGRLGFRPATRRPRRTGSRGPCRRPAPAPRRSGRRRPGTGHCWPRRHCAP